MNNGAIFRNGVNFSSQIVSGGGGTGPAPAGEVILTKAEYDALGDEKLTNGVDYYITDWTEETQTVNSPFNFGINEDGEYGYYKKGADGGADTFVPFKKNSSSLELDLLDYWFPQDDHEHEINWKDHKYLIFSYTWIEGGGPIPESTIKKWQNDTYEQILSFSTIVSTNTFLSLDSSFAVHEPIYNSNWQRFYVTIRPTKSSENTIYAEANNYSIGLIVRGLK